LDSLSYKNNIDFAKESGFNVTVVERGNFKTFIPKETAESLEKILRML
jgi:hypothetical protein